MEKDTNVKLTKNQLKRRNKKRRLSSNGDASGQSSGISAGTSAKPNKMAQPVKKARISPGKVQSLRQQSNRQLPRANEQPKEGNKAKDDEDQSINDSDGKSAHESDEDTTDEQHYQANIDYSSEDIDGQREKDADSVGGTGDELSDEEQDENDDNVFNPRQKKPRSTAADRVHRKLRQFRRGTSDEEVIDPISNCRLPLDTYEELREFRRRAAAERSQGPSLRADSTFRILQGAMAEPLQSLDHDSVIRFRDNLLKLQGSDYSVNLENMISSKLQSGMKVRFFTQGWVKEDNLDAWKHWPLATFIQRMLIAYPRSTQISTGSAAEMIGDIPFSFNTQDINCLDKYFTRVWEQYEKFTPSSDLGLQAALEKELPAEDEEGRGWRLG